MQDANGLQLLPEAMIAPLMAPMDDQAAQEAAQLEADARAAFAQLDA